MSKSFVFLHLLLERDRSPAQRADGGGILEMFNLTQLADVLRAGGDRPNFVPCTIDSLDEWLMERYTAFNSVGGRRRFFRVWHPPWPQCSVDVELDDLSLLTQNWRWFADARLVGANFSPGFHKVWMGRPHGL